MKENQKEFKLKKRILSSKMRIQVNLYIFGHNLSTDFRIKLTLDHLKESTTDYNAKAKHAFE